MAGSKRDRQRMTGHARRAAAAKARQRSLRRRQLMIGGACVFVVVAVALVVWRPWTDDAKSVKAAGKPCVPVADPLPSGAPAVPVKVGPRPATLVTEDLKAGEGAAVAPGATVTVNYIGVSCSTGKIFDSSWSRNQPATFPLDQVIEGWKQGIPGMKVGGQRLLGIPPDLAYGAAGRPPDISPDEALWFVVDAVDTKATEQAPSRSPQG